MVLVGMVGGSGVVANSGLVASSRMVASSGMVGWRLLELGQVDPQAEPESWLLLLLSSSLF